MPKLFEEIAYLLAESEGLEPAPLAGQITDGGAHLARVASEIRMGTDSKIGVSALICQADTEVKTKGHQARLRDVPHFLLQNRVNTPEGKIGLAAGVALRGHRRQAEIRDLEKVVKPLDYDLLQWIERKRVDELAENPNPERGPAQYDDQGGRHAAPGSERGEVWAALLLRVGASKAEEILQGVTAYNVAQRKIARIRAEQAKDVVEASALV